MKMQHDDPFVCQLIPEGCRVAVEVFDIRQDGVALVWSEGTASVIAVCNRLAERFAIRPGTSPTSGCIDRYDRLFFARLEAGSVVLIDNSGTGIYRAQMVGVNYSGQLRPMDQVRADGMTPGLVVVVSAVVPAVGVVLIAKVIFTIVIYQPVVIADPPSLC